MALSEKKLMEYNKRLLISRMRILSKYGFYGLLLMHMRFVIDEKCETAATDGSKIYFGPKFLDKLSDKEVDFVMMHEILHAALVHCMRRADRNHFMFNVACDIVVNSNILYSNDMDISSITIAGYDESMHLTPGGDEGYKYTAEEVYDMILNDCSGGNTNQSQAANSSVGSDAAFDGTWDDHTLWGEGDEDYEIMAEVWRERVLNSVESVSIDKESNRVGGIPLFARRMLAEMKAGTVDWRAILQEFIQSEINDYSFSPPDRRFDDTGFFLPDYNERDERVEGVWFVIDTSGSVSDSELSAAYSEICSAIEQFSGKLEGKLSFMEWSVTDPIDFDDIDSLMEIKPVGGGGTNFSGIFRYMQKNLSDNLPSYIVIITDGYGCFPPEKEAMGVPVLWLINNDQVVVPWGKVARIRRDI